MSLSHRLLYMRFPCWLLLPVLAILAAGAATANPAPAPTSQVRHDRKVYDFWTVGCSYPSGPAKTKTCTASLPVRHNGSKQLIVILIVAPDNKGEMRFHAVVPTSTLVQPGVIIKFDRGGEITLPILSCNPNACVASLPYSKAIETRLAGAKKIDVRWTNIVSGLVGTAFSIKGAKEALAALER
jgi:invasion protein IalB